jgi:hypothetical protein
MSEARTDRPKIQNKICKTDGKKERQKEKNLNTLEVSICAI